MDILGKKGKQKPSFEQGLKLLVRKVEKIDNVSWEELVKKLGLDVHKDTLRKAFAVGEYSGYNIMKHFESKLENVIDDIKIIEDLKNLKQEIYKERVKLRDQRRELNKIMTGEARFEHLVEVLKEEVKGLKPVGVANGYHSNKHIHKEGSTAILQLADWHYGKIIDLPTNKYDTSTVMKRVHSLIKKTLNNAKIHKINHLVVEIMGDMVDGIINTGTKLDHEEDVISQIINVSEILSYTIDILSQSIPKVTVYTVLGNHGRLLPNKKEVVSRENFERMIPEFLRLRLQHHRNVAIFDSKGLDFLEYRIGNKHIVLSHGQNDKLGTCVKDFTTLLGFIPDEIHTAHRHYAYSINDNGTIVTISGSLVGCDDYSLSLRKNSKASQNLIIYDNNNDRCVYELVVQE